MAPGYEACVAIRDAFRERNLPLFVAYYRRSLPRFERVKRWLERGAIGEPRLVSWHLTKPANDLDRSGAHNWRTDAAIAPGGYFDDLASHGLDLISYLLGDIETATGVSTAGTLYRQGRRYRQLAPYRRGRRFRKLDVQRWGAPRPC